MDDVSKNSAVAAIDDLDELSQFTESYDSFNRIINSLQRRYIALEEEATAQNRELAEANRRLVELSERNLATTAFLAGILNSISVGVVAVDRQGRITHFNPAASLILGVRQGVPIGRLYRDVIPPGSPVEANALRAIQSGSEVEAVDKRLELPDGTLLNLSVSTAIIRDESGVPCGAVEAFSDLTKLKRMEQELARLNTMAALGEMAATIAHEVRNPLAGIGGFAALLERDLVEDNPQREIARKIVRGVETINETITTLLNYSRFEELKPIETNVEEFLLSVIEQYRRENPDRVEKTSIVLHKPQACRDQIISLRLDAMLARQVFFNIFSNAIEACAGKGQIDLRFDKLPRQSAVSRYTDRVLLGPDETVVEMTITDTGPGIAPEDIDRIFAPFFTTKGGGNGLGLAVAWKIIKRHGGEIFARNSDDGGAVFHILMPTRIDPVKMEPAQ